MGTKKAAGKSKSAASKPRARRSTTKKEKPVNMAEVRENISNMVGASANEIAREVIATAIKGALAPARYMFEVAGLYPATEATESKPEEESFALSLVKRLKGLPEPPKREDDEEPDEGEVEAEKVNVAVEGESGE